MEDAPEHIGIILDGNRRFAKRLMKTPWKGHEWGAKKVEKLLDWCIELNIKKLTLYAFSIENLNRPKREFDFLMDLFEKEFSRIAEDNKIHKNRVKINIIGRPDLLPKRVQKALRRAMDATKNYDNFAVNFAIAYGGRQEILDATKKIVFSVQNGNLDASEINEETFRHNLYTNGFPDPDLIIRTGESRLSGFLLWQSSYAELIFLPEVLWPEFSKKHFVECINEYKERKRRFGR